MTSLLRSVILGLLSLSFLLALSLFSAEKSSFTILFILFCHGEAQAVPLNDPTYPLPLRKGLSKASYEISSGNASKAIATLTPLMKTYPDYTALFTLAGIAYGRAGNHLKAIEMENRALALSPHNVSARTALGIAYGNTGHFKKEAKEEISVLQSHPKSETAWEALGWAYASLGDWKSARMAEEKAVTLNGKDPQARMMLGLALAHQGYLEEGLIMERTAEKLKPNDAGIKRSIAYITVSLHPSGSHAPQNHPGFNPLLQPTPGPATSTATPTSSQQMSPSPIKAPSVLH
jgi:Flp pilus assembly protein TadD